MDKVNRELFRRYMELKRKEKEVQEELEKIRAIVAEDGRKVFPYSDFIVRLIPGTRKTVSYKDLLAIAPELAEQLVKVSNFDTLRFSNK